MKARFFSLALLLALSFSTKAQQLKSFYPAKFFTQSEPTVMQLTINGTDMWPNYLTITQTIQVMHVHFKKNGRDEQIRGISISKTTQTVEFISGDWLKTPGDIEVYITIDGTGGITPYRSNSLYLPVLAAPANAPVIKNLSDSHFNTGEKRENYYIRIYGSNYGEEKSTYASIGGVYAPAGWQNLPDGVMDVWVPEQVFTRAGTYPVTVTSKNGTSNPVMLTIEQPVVKLQNDAVKRMNTQRQQPIQTQVISNTNKMQTVNMGTTGSIKNEVKLRKDLVASTTLVKGIRVIISGVAADGGTEAQLENFITKQEYVFLVDNQVKIAEGNTQLDIKLKATGVDNSVAEALKKRIEEKAASLHISVAVGY